MRKECAEGRKAYNGGQEVIRERNSSFLFSSLPLAFFLESWNRSLVVQVAYWAYAPNKEWVKLAQNYAPNKKYVLNSKQHLTTSFYGIVLSDGLLWYRCVATSGRTSLSMALVWHCWMTANMATLRLVTSWGSLCKYVHVLNYLVRSICIVHVYNAWHDKI